LLIVVTDGAVFDLTTCRRGNNVGVAWKRAVKLTWESSCPLIQRIWQLMWKKTVAVVRYHQRRQPCLLAAKTQAVCGVVCSYILS